jgi:hypothetical protein
MPILNVIYVHYLEVSELSAEVRLHHTLDTAQEMYLKWNIVVEIRIV